MYPVYVLCGVPGSGKSWVMDRLGKGVKCIHQDNYIGERHKLMSAIEASANVAVTVVDCPFGERLLKSDLERRGLKPRLYFVVEAPEVLRERIQARDGRPARNADIARGSNMSRKAEEYGAPSGNSAQILALLQGAMK